MDNLACQHYVNFITSEGLSPKLALAVILNFNLSNNYWKRSHEALISRRTIEFNVNHGYFMYNVNVNKHEVTIRKVIPQHDVHFVCACFIGSKHLEYVWKICSIEHNAKWFHYPTHILVNCIDCIDAIDWFAASIFKLR